MKVIVDTPVWSEFFRRKQPAIKVLDELERLIRKGEVVIFGSIRQEVLSGVKDERQFVRLKNRMQFFRDDELSTPDFERAAEYHNGCRSRGIQGSAIDFLICSAAARIGAEIFTLDQDFERYAEVLPIKLYKY